MSNQKTDLRQTEDGLSSSVQSWFITVFAANGFPFSSSRSSFTTLVLFSTRHTTVHTNVLVVTVSVLCHYRENYEKTMSTKFWKIVGVCETALGKPDIHNTVNISIADFLTVIMQHDSEILCDCKLWPFCPKLGMSVNCAFGMIFPQDVKFQKPSNLDLYS